MVYWHILSWHTSLILSCSCKHTACHSSLDEYLHRKIWVKYIIKHWRTSALLDRLAKLRHIDANFGSVMIQKLISWRVFLPLLHFGWQSFHGPFGSHASKMFCKEKRLCLHGFFRVTSAVVTSVKHAVPLTSKSKNQSKKRVAIFCMWCWFLVSRRVRVFQSSMISIQQTLHKTEINKLQNSYTLLPYILAWITVCKHWAKKSSLRFDPDRYWTEIWESQSFWLQSLATWCSLS